jgi:tetratricopeptide (TPR) repeat protein
LRVIAASLWVLLLAVTDAAAFELCDSASKLEEFRKVLPPVREAFREKRFDELDKRLNALLAAHEAGKITDAEANRVLRVFEVAVPANEPLHLDWLQAHPRSQAAHLALAAHYVARGFAARGSDLGNKTSDMQIQAMVDAFKKVLFVLDKADALSKKPTISLAHRISVATATGNHQESTRIYRKAIKDFPDTLQVRIRYLWASNPKWGGSMEQLAAIAEETKGLSEADRRYIRYLVLLEMGSAYLTIDDDKLGAAAYDKSIPLCPGFDDGLEALMRIHTRTKNFDALLPAVERYLERYPRSGWAYSTRGWVNQEKKNWRASFDDYEKAVALGYGHAYQGLAWHYEWGKAVPVDYKRAIELYMIADSHGVKGAREKAEKVSKGTGIPIR